MAFTKPPARRGTGDFFPVAKRPYTRKPTGPGSDNSPYYYGGGGRKPGPSVPKPDRAPGLAPGQATPNYGTMPVPKAQAAVGAATAATTAGAKADALSQYLAGITDPAERAYVAAQIGPQIAALNAQRDTLNRQAAAQQQALQGFTQALIEHIKGIDYTGQYADIANSQVAAGQAAGESLAAANPQGGTAAILNAIGAPEQQAADLEKLNRDVFTGGGAVLTGTGGTIPSFQTAGEGVGVLGWAAAQPGIAAATGEENMRQLLASEAEAQGKVSTDLQAVLAGIPKAQQDFATQQAQAKTDADNQSMALYNSGMITQRELARRLKLPNWQKYPDTPRGDASKPIIKTRPDGSIVAIDPTTLKTTQLAGPNAKPAKLPDAKPFQHVTIGGKGYMFDPNTGYYYDPATGKRAVPTTAQKKGKQAGPRTVNMELSRSLHQWVDGAGVPIPALANVPPPTDTSGLAPSVPGNRFSPTQTLKFKGDAETLAKNAWFGRKDPKDNKKFIAPPLHYQQAMAEMRKAGIPLEFAQAALNRWWTKPGFERDIKQYVKKGRVYFYRSRGTGEGRPLSPKVPAAADGGNYAAYVNVPQGVDRPGASTHTAVLDFVGQIAQVYGQKLTVGTGTRHNRLVKGSDHESAHWTGWAVDIPKSGSELTRLGQDALIAAGMPEAQARKVTHWDGGDYNGYNILFNTNVGGNHFNHLHVGLRPSRQQDAQYASSESATSPQGARALGQTMAVGYGWRGREWTALDQLWNAESGWDYQIHNKQGSGAWGIPQALGHSLPSDYATNPRTQIEWGLNYIKNTFRTPSRAWAFWRATVNRNANLAPPDLRAKAQYWIAHGYTGY